MQRFYQLVFIVSLLALSWFGMMAVHELGHVLGAVASGGSVTRVVISDSRLVEEKRVTTGVLFELRQATNMANSITAGQYAGKEML